MSQLRKVDKPADLKKMNIKQLNSLAQEVRELILDTCAKNGGHLAPSLGVVELTIALHYVMDTTRDRIIWDVGHQAYAHKILTGRKDRFASLRQFGGISGFPRREESIHDAFDTGHSSTSISAALGYALSRNYQGQDYRVTAVIGDGSLTGGQAFEAMNEAGHLGIKLLVILNDNEMSIAQNVGALSLYLSRLRADPNYTKRKKVVSRLLQKIPLVGSPLLKAGERIKDSLKYLLVPGILFEELGFTYLGPIDGHNIQEIAGVLKKADTIEGPVLLHVVTQKGKGYQPAEDNPTLYHGVGPFDLQSGQILKDPGPPNYTSVFGEALIKLAEQDERIMALTAAMPEGTGLSGFAQRFPQRFCDVGIAEQNAVTVASAMALNGLRPVVAIYSTFMQRAYDQVLHDMCLQKAPVLLALDRAGLVGEDGATHQGAFDLSYLRHIPNLAVMAPKDEGELRHMLYTSLNYDGPTAIRYPRGRGIGVDIGEPFQKLPWGKGEILEVGNDLVILAIGSMVYPALATRNILADKGISCTVINARFIKPLDQDLILDAAKKHKGIVTMEENVVAGGFGSAVLELLANQGLTDKKILNIGLPDSFIRHGKSDMLRENVGLSPEKMAERITSHFALSGTNPVKVVFSRGKQS